MSRLARAGRAARRDRPDPAAKSEGCAAADLAAGDRAARRQREGLADGGIVCVVDGCGGVRGSSGVGGVSCFDGVGGCGGGESTGGAVRADRADRERVGRRAATDRGTRGSIRSSPRASCSAAVRPATAVVGRRSGSGAEFHRASIKDSGRPQRAIRSRSSTASGRRRGSTSHARNEASTSDDGADPAPRQSRRSSPTAAMSSLGRDASRSLDGARQASPAPPRTTEPSGATSTCSVPMSPWTRPAEWRSMSASSTAIPSAITCPARRGPLRRTDSSDSDWAGTRCVNATPCGTGAIRTRVADVGDRRSSKVASAVCNSTRPGPESMASPQSVRRTPVRSIHGWSSDGFSGVMRPGCRRTRRLRWSRPQPPTCDSRPTREGSRP